MSAFKREKQINNLFDIKERFIDLNVIECGREQCAPIKYVAALAKTCYTLHIVENGKGYISYDGKTVPLRANDMFLIFPGQLVDYYPDSNAPWSYYWICFEGLKADEMALSTGMTAERPYRQQNPHRELMSYFSHAVETFEKKGQIVPECLGFLYVILGTLADGSEKMELLSTKQRYVKEALTYIYFNFAFNISVADIANNLRLTPNYLSMIFREETGMSPKQYISQYRMELAYKNLQKPGVLIKDVAEGVGFKDPLYFSKEFRKYWGVTPREAIKKTVENPQ